MTGRVQWRTPSSTLRAVDVLPHGNRSLAIYSTDVTPDEVAEQTDGVLHAGLGGLKAHLEG